jgi:hypothetical protein
MSAIPANTRSWWLSPGGIALLLALASGALAWWLIAAPVAALANVKSHPLHFPHVFAHMVGGTIMLFVGAANLYVGSTRRFWRHHKLLGYLYLSGGAVSASLALALALASPHRKSAAGLPLAMGNTDEIGYALAMLAAAWLVCAAMGFRAARNRRHDSHRAWMIRSYVLVWSFVSCRLIAKVPGLGEFGSSAAIVWLSWVVPFVVCEIALQWRAGKALAA